MIVSKDIIKNDFLFKSCKDCDFRYDAFNIGFCSGIAYVCPKIMEESKQNIGSLVIKLLNLYNED